MWNAIWFDKKSPCWDLVDIELRSGPAKGWYGRELRIVGVSTQTCYAAVASFSIQGPLPSPGGWNSLTFRFKNNHLDLCGQCFWGDSRAEDNDPVHKNNNFYTFLHFSKPTFSCYSNDPGMPGYDSWSAQPWYLWYQECLCLAGRAWRPGCASSSAQPASGQTSPEAAIRLIYRLTFCLLT